MDVPATELVLNEEEIKTVRCRFGCTDMPIGIYHVPEGCICYRDPIQALCAHHFSRAQSEGHIIWLIARFAKGITVGWQGAKSDEPKQ